MDIIGDGPVMLWLPEHDHQRTHPAHDNDALSGPLEELPTVLAQGTYSLVALFGRDVSEVGRVGPVCDVGAQLC
jgi:hypothetical protein